MAGQLRQRRGGKKKSKESKKAEETKEPSPPPVQDNDQQETAWQTVKKHPLAMVAPLVAIPYTLYLAFYYLVLQRPDIITAATHGMIQLRPAVSMTDERQVLIVGSMSSGTVQVASDLSEYLKLEIGHESSDADWEFVRDGTVSWFHGIRFLEPIEMKDLVMRWSILCGNNYTANMGFHPNMYQSTTSSCSTRRKWSKCWAKQCFEVLNEEWACADDDCVTPFQTTLFQVRHPLRTMESLVTKFCQGGLNGTIHPAFVTYASALFPDHNYTQDNCIEATGYYVVEYNQAMLKALKKGTIKDMYHVEETTPCQVAQLAGFMDKSTIVYPPNYDKVTKACRDPDHAANQVMESTKHKVNVGQVSLKWQDLRGGMHASTRPKGDKSLERRVRELTKTLGYNPDQDEQYDFD